MKTVFRPNPNWWGKAEHNLDEVVFQTIKSDATRVAALLSGDIDLIDPVPVQDIDAHQGQRQRHGAHGPGAAHHLPQHGFACASELLYSNVKGTNPFKDARVRTRLLPGHRYRGDQDQGHARHVGAHGAA